MPWPALHRLVLAIRKRLRVERPAASSLSEVPDPSMRRALAEHTRRGWLLALESGAMRRWLKTLEDVTLFDPAISESLLRLSLPAAAATAVLKAVAKTYAHDIDGHWSLVRFARSGRVVEVGLFDTADSERFYELLFTRFGRTHRAAPPLSATIVTLGATLTTRQGETFEVIAAGKSKRWRAVPPSVPKRSRGKVRS